MGSREAHILALLCVLFLAAVTWVGGRALRRHRDHERSHPYTLIARRLNSHPMRERCDDQLSGRRLYSAAVADHFSDEIRALWQERSGGDTPKFSLLDLGPIQLRVNPRQPAGSGFDSSSWTWEEAHELIRKTQMDPAARDNDTRWRDLDSMVRYLIEKDYGRLILRRRYLSPEATEHSFRPNPGVRRSGGREFTVRLNPGDFSGKEPVLKQMLESEWQSDGYRVLLEWSTDPGVYRILSHRENSRSFVNHRSRVMAIAHLAWTKTVAHELGHVLGFDDHYYNVWHPEHCYYSQESRLGDLMSNSERGVVGRRHWELLEQAYPWKAEPRKDPFVYTYGKEAVATVPALKQTAPAR